MARIPQCTPWPSRWTGAPTLAARPTTSRAPSTAHSRSTRRRPAASAAASAAGSTISPSASCPLPVPPGTVTSVNADEDTVRDASVTSCTVAKIKGWRFPTEGAEEAAEVTFTVVFSGET